MYFPIAIIILLCGVIQAVASDHIDGPVTTEHGVADLADLYAFPSNEGKTLSLILNAYPFVSNSGHFSQKVRYAIVIRKAEVKRGEGQIGFATSDELRIECTFNDRHGTKRSLTCKGEEDLTATTTQGAKTSTGDFQLYFGRRSDPFFFDADWSLQLLKEPKLPPPSQSNTMAALNILSIAIEIDREKIFGGAFTLLAIAAESITQDGPDQPLRRIDRLGRPEITNVSLVARGEQEDIRDRYNAVDAFNLGEQDIDIFRTRLVAGIKYYDLIDGKSDWHDGDAEQFAALLIQDHLIVDLAKPCPAGTFLEIERAVLASRPHTTCGGRQLTDDIMDKLYTVFINNERRAPVGDGVDKPDKKVSADFPYLADPATGVWPWLKAMLAGTFLR